MFELKEGPSPSTIPCSPAPGRALLIVKDNAQPDQGAMFLSFDSILSSVSTSSLSTVQDRAKAAFTLSNDHKQDLTGLNASVGTMSPATKRKWGLLRSLIPFTSSTALKTKSPSEHARSSEALMRFQKDLPIEQTNNFRANKEDTLRKPKEQGSWFPAGSQAFPPYRSFSFKFTLDWYDRGSAPTNDRTIRPPRLPPPNSLPIVSGNEVSLNNLDPQKRPEGPSVASSQYAGRALVEWNLLVDESRSFFERRRREGVPTDEKVETPLLGIDALNSSRH